MHDNPQAAQGLVFALPDHRVISLSGRDAAAFAQAQFMNDVKLLAPGQWHWSGWLTPKGRVIALFALLKLDEEALWLLVPDADPVTLAAALQRFVFRAKVSITVRDELRVEGSFAGPLQARSHEMSGSAESALELDMGAEGGRRTLRILPASTATQEPTQASQWMVFDVEHGLPRLPASQSDQWTPQQLSLERLRAFSVKKGCYPGQEIVARTHFLGRAKRGLALFACNAPVPVGTAVQTGADVVGEIVSGADNRVLAVVTLERPLEAAQADGTELLPLQLRSGLER